MVAFININYKQLSCVTVHGLGYCVLSLLKLAITKLYLNNVFTF